MNYYCIHANHVTDVIKAESIRAAISRFKELWPEANIVHAYRLNRPPMTFK